MSRIKQPPTVARPTTPTAVDKAQSEVVEAARAESPAEVAETPPAPAADLSGARAQSEARATLQARYDLEGAALSADERRQMGNAARGFAALEQLVSQS
jgi:hypothetical protein